MHIPHAWCRTHAPTMLCAWEMHSAAHMRGAACMHVLRCCMPMRDDSAPLPPAATPSALPQASWSCQFLLQRSFARRPSMSPGWRCQSCPFQAPCLVCTWPCRNSPWPPSRARPRLTDWLDFAILLDTSFPLRCTALPLFITIVVVYWHQHCARLHN